MQLLDTLPAHVASSVRSARARRRQPDDHSTHVSPFSGPAVPWGGPLSAGRSVGLQSILLSEVDRTRHALGATVSEITLASVAGSVEAYLRSRDTLPAKSLTTVVPVAVPGEEARSSGNRNTHTYATLATDVKRPVDRLRHITAIIRANRRRTTVATIDSWVTWMDYYPLFRAVYLLTVIPMGRLLKRPLASLIVSVVRGPRSDLEINGRPVEEMFSVSILTEHLGLNVTVWSYRGRLSLAVTCTRALAPLATEIAAGIPGALAQLSADERAAGVTTR